jgi:hypothetical protein
LSVFEPESFKATTKEGAGKSYEIIYKIGGTQKIQVNAESTQDD